MSETNQTTDFRYHRWDDPSRDDGKRTCVECGFPEAQLSQINPCRGKPQTPLRERVARALFDHSIGEPEGLAWERVHESVREGYLRAADVIEQVDVEEIKRLRTVIRAAREELEDGGAGESAAYLILKHSGVR